jgi:hypothetical protein
MSAPFVRGVLFPKPFDDRFTLKSDSPFSDPHKRYLTCCNQLIDFPSGDSKHLGNVIRCQYFLFTVNRALFSHAYAPFQIHSLTRYQLCHGEQKNLRYGIHAGNLLYV